MVNIDMKRKQKNYKKMAMVGVDMPTHMLLKDISEYTGMSIGATVEKIFQYVGLEDTKGSTANVYTTLVLPEERRKFKEWQKFRREKEKNE